MSSHHHSSIVAALKSCQQGNNSSYVQAMEEWIDGPFMQTGPGTWGWDRRMFQELFGLFTNAAAVDSVVERLGKNEALCAIPGIWEYQGDHSKHNITNELVKENICKSLSMMSTSNDKGRISSAIANEHHFHNSITRRNVLDLSWGCGPTDEVEQSYHGCPPDQGCPQVSHGYGAPPPGYGAPPGYGYPNGAPFSGYGVPTGYGPNPGFPPPNAQTPPGQFAGPLAGLAPSAAMAGGMAAMNAAFGMAQGMQGAIQASLHPQSMYQMPQQPQQPPHGFGAPPGFPHGFGATPGFPPGFSAPPGSPGCRKSNPFRRPAFDNYSRP